ncbi:MAG: hypothetical protein ACXVYM_06315 [Gaiellaceae bacterium]
MLLKRWARRRLERRAEALAQALALGMRPAQPQPVRAATRGGFTAR